MENGAGQRLFGSASDRRRGVTGMKGKCRTARYVPGTAMRTGCPGREDTAARRRRSWRQGQRCISGRSPVSPERRAPARCFSAAVPLRCVFCQNSLIAEGGAGQAVGVKELSGVFLRLQEQGANNINLVTPTHFVPRSPPRSDWQSGRACAFRWYIIREATRRRKP